MITVNKKEVYRYLGYRSQPKVEPTAELDQRIDDCLAVLQRTARPQCTYRRFPLVHDQNVLTFGSITTSSRHLQKNLADCSYVYILAATLGIEVDRLIQRSEITHILDAAIYQAAGAAMIESYVDDINAQIKTEAQENGFFTHPRYSPGYGDFDLSYQKDVLSLIDAGRIGIRLTDSCLMVPSKSVTAVIGCSSTSYDCKISGCLTCAQQDCMMRKE